MVEQDPAGAYKGSRDLKEDEHAANRYGEILLPEGYVVIAESDHVM